MQTSQIIEQYYAAFNRGDLTNFFDLLDDDIIHEINQGQCEVGKAAFQKFMEHMQSCYQETVTDLVIFSHPDNTRAAAEFLVQGRYIKTDKGFPEARNQTYEIPAGAFFEIREGKITRITNYYNVQEWVKMISAPV